MEPSVVGTFSLILSKDALFSAFLGSDHGNAGFKNCRVQTVMNRNGISKSRPATHSLKNMHKHRLDHRSDRRDHRSQITDHRSDRRDRLIRREGARLNMPGSDYRWKPLKSLIRSA
jgi:hypothetical protein